MPSSAGLAAALAAALMASAPGLGPAGGRVIWVPLCGEGHGIEMRLPAGDDSDRGPAAGGACHAMLCDGQRRLRRRQGLSATRRAGSRNRI